MSEEEANRLRASNQLLDSNNKILAQRLKNKDKEIKLANDLYLKQKSKLSEIYRVVSSKKINENNYTDLVEWIKKYIMEN